MENLFSLEINGINMKGFYKKKNSKKLLIFVHGFGGNYLESENLFDFLSNGIEIDSLSLSLPGNFPSSGLYEEYTVESFVEVVKKQVQYFSKNYDEIILVGLSFGSLISALVSKDISLTKLKKIVLLSPVWNIYDTASTVYNEAKQKGLLVDDHAVFGNNLKISVEFLKKAKVNVADESLKNFNGEVLIIQPEKDLIFERRNCDRYIKFFKNINYNLLKNQTHCFEGDKKYEVLDLIKLFIGG